MTCLLLKALRFSHCTKPASAKCRGLVTKCKGPREGERIEAKQRLFFSFWPTFVHNFHRERELLSVPAGNHERLEYIRCLGYNRRRYVSKSFILAKCVLFLLLHVRKMNVICEHLKVYLLYSAVCWNVNGEKRSNCDNCLGLAEKLCGHLPQQTKC